MEANEMNVNQSAVPKRNAFDMTIDEWRAFVQDELGLPRYTADQICQWIYQKKVFDFAAMTNLSKTLRAQLPELIDIRLPRLAKVQVSQDRTRKYLWRLDDGQFIESVLMDHGNHFTACISSQVGCPLRCGFCATGQQGFTRNLTAGEIV
ncbi:MAG: 23S rRNA (adenine(2503)-C(2))-methyltransferase RlmN, partial [Pyramidobacter sp.]|nr:23S rRNA (adenine(2503)-C(2))-methyltransferase RlmN [Pyramidobacter sp.]